MAGFVSADATGNRSDPEPPTSLTRRLKLASILSRLRSLQSASKRRRASGVISAMTRPEILRSRRKWPASVREGRLVEGVGKANSSTRPSPCPSVHRHARSIIAVRRSSLLDVWSKFPMQYGPCLRRSMWSSTSDSSRSAVTECEFVDVYSYIPS
jgi:hypothetical protein